MSYPQEIFADRIKVTVDDADERSSQVEEVGATSAPLTSAAFFIGAACRDFNDDYMLCRAENNQPEHCLKEGRKVTRCASNVLKQIRSNCADQFKEHWGCLDRRNMQYKHCRKEESTLNACVFEKLGWNKVVPGADPTVTDL